MAVKKVVRAPRQRQRVRAIGLLSRRGFIRINKKIPATTMVLECSRADTGVGPSIAEGSQGWRPNWADFPVAATITARRGRVRSRFLAAVNICGMSHELRLVAIHAIAKMSPISPTRLYRTACRAAVLASDRACHQPIRRNDIMPTPSHPRKNWNMLFAVTRTSIATRKARRYLKNRSARGSECIYQRANSRIAQDT